MRYEPRCTRRQTRLYLRGLDYCVHEWGLPGAPPLVLLHGWMDTGATWQFLVDALADGRHVIAPDWRGFGDSGWAAGGYWFADYLADLEALLDHYAPQTAVHMIGHSMGGNVAGLYAGIRPQRIEKLVQIEGFGLRSQPSSAAVERYRTWLDQLQSPAMLVAPASYGELAGRLMRRHPNLTPSRADFVARAWARQQPDGGLEMRADPAHKRVNPVLYRLEEAEACWSEIAAPALWIEGSASHVTVQPGYAGERQRRMALYRDCTLVRVADAGHMVHHDQPAAVATAITRFL